MTRLNTDPEKWGDEAYFCDACEKPFRTPMFDISKGYERTIYDGNRMPEVEIIGSGTIAQYCSDPCRVKKISAVLAKENVRATYPDIGPVEACSRCGKPVDMTKFHLTYVDSDTEQDWDRMCATVTKTVVLAVLCDACAPPPQRLIAETDFPVSIKSEDLPPREYLKVD
ncbi:MAG: hypothetical protein M0P95_11990 [Sulfuritalea sp.]|nr:hypothetical protein [Sulfuritalea sp.]